MIKISFVLSSLNRSGGSRVTVDMGNLLLKKGYKTRIIVGKPVFSLKNLIRTALLKFKGASFHNWGSFFEGETLYFENCLDEISFDDGEVVIGVGTDGTQLCRNLKQPVMKIRFCHGFDSNKPDLMKEIWGGDDMETITVSGTHVPYLDEYSGKKTLGIVPNGVKPDMYYQMDLKRDGIGMVYGTHHNKAPEFTRKILTSIMNKWPEIPLYVFGESNCPSCLPDNYYYRYPSIDKSRELYNRSIIWLIPSRSEGLPAPPLEAMACGAVVISTDNLGSREIIEDDKNGLLVPVGDIEAFMEKINFLLENKDERQRLSNNAFETVKKYSWEKATDSMEKVLNTLVSEDYEK